MKIFEEILECRSSLVEDHFGINLEIFENKFGNTSLEEDSEIRVYQENLVGPSTREHW